MAFMLSALLQTSSAPVWGATGARAEGETSLPLTNPAERKGEQFRKSLRSGLAPAVQKCVEKKERGGEREISLSYRRSLLAKRGGRN